MSKFNVGKASVLALTAVFVTAAFLLFGTNPAYALTLSQGTIDYYTQNTNSIFIRSLSPFTAGVTSQTDNPDGSVTVSVTGTGVSSADSGFVFFDGKLGDLSDFTLTGTGAQYRLNIWFDVNVNGVYFIWSGTNVFTGVDGDTSALGPYSSSGVMNITDSSQFYLMSNSTTYTLAQLKAGDAGVAGITRDTNIAIWVGITAPNGGAMSATINFPTPTPTPTTTPTPTPLTCSGDQHLDASGLNCVSYQFGGPPPPPPANGEQVLGASTTSTGQVLGASTLAATGSFAENLYIAIMALGGIIITVGVKNFKKAI